MRGLKIILVVLFVAAIGGALTSVYLYSRTPYGWKTTTLTVTQGMGVTEIGHLLAREGIITSPRLFVGLARLKGKGRRLQAGEFEFAPLMTPMEVLDRIAEGDVVVHRVTLVEGWTLKDIAQYLEQEGYVKAEDFLRLCGSKEMIDRVEPGIPSLEGYLFPDTYNVNIPVSAVQLVGIFLARFAEIYTAEFVRRQGELGFSRHAIVTLASIIEKEARIAEERPLVASVFYNRIARKMPLAADPTVVYGLNDFAGIIRKSHLAEPHAYNTYIYEGLPPGPIANPGLDSIRATLWPAETPFLYFVSKNDGTHHFSATAEEHQSRVEQYQR